MIKNLLTFILVLCGVSTFAQQKVRPISSDDGPVRLSQVRTSDPNNKNLGIGASDNVMTFTDTNGNQIEIPGSLSSGSCGFVEAREKQLEKYPELGTDDDFELWMKETIQREELNAQTAVLTGPECNVRFIPYVVHICHPGDAVNTVGNVTGTNISAAQVASQISAMNEAFRKTNLDRNNVDTWDDVSADFRIEFVPALINPDTGLPLAEPGINRVDLVANNFPVGTDFNNAGDAVNAFDGMIKPATIMDPTQVANIWTIDLAQNTGGLFGYSQFPSTSGLGGIPANGGAANTDGNVIDVFSFQRTADNDGSFTGFFDALQEGGITVHEFGHWFGLRHIDADDGGGCTADDFVADTPLQASPSGFNGSGGCQSAGTDSCPADDFVDMVQNYMDVSGDSCFDLFTLGQMARSEAVLANSPRRMELTFSPVADPPAREPFVFFEVEDIIRDEVEAEGCSPFQDILIRPRILDCTNMAGSPVATVTVNTGLSTAVEGVDFEFISGNTATFAGTGPEVLGIPVRIFSDSVIEGNETIVFDISLNAGGSDAILHPDPAYLQAVWNVDDATEPMDISELNFVDQGDPDTTPDPCFEQDITLEILTDNFPGETTWELVDDGTGAVIQSGGPLTAPATLITENFTLPIGSYTFTIFDQFADGICCGFGPGEYTLSSNGTVIATGGMFGASESTTFCVDNMSEVGTFNGVIPVNASVNEVENCGDDFSEYFLAINTSACVTAEASYTATVEIDPSSTATLGDDFVFPMGNIVTFQGNDAETVVLPIRFLSDQIAEGSETLVLNISLSSNLANLGADSTTTITILDTDLPILTIASVTRNVNETEYNCESDSNLFDVTVSLGGCISSANIEFSLVQSANSVALEEVDFNFVGDTTFEYTDANLNEVAVFTIEVFNDGILEGEELLLLDLELVDPLSASITNSDFPISIFDPLGITAPSVSEIGFIDFENGLPQGWVISKILEDEPNDFVVGSNSDLPGNAVHVTNDAMGNQAFLYDNNTVPSTIVLLSPPFLIDGPTPYDFLFQVEGEAGFFAPFDFGFVGLVDGSIPIDDTAGIAATQIGVFLQGAPMPTEFSNFSGFTDLEFYNTVGGFTGPVRLAFQFVNDDSITNQPPLAVDEIDLTGVSTGTFIETSKMIGNEIPEYPLDADSDTYYYNTQDFDIAMRMNSSSDNGCSSGWVSQAGSGTQQLISEFSNEFTTEKIFTFQTEQPDEDASLEVGLYYTEVEIAGWEAATGRDRSELQMFKTSGFSPVTGFGGDIEINILLDNFPAETTFTLVNDETGATVLSGGPFNGAGATVIEQVTLPEGNYTFTIFDQFNDGICCGFGDGMYSVTSGTDVIAEGGVFGASESTSFFVTDNILELCQDYRDIDFAPVTLIPYVGGGGFQAVANFDTGLAEITGFGLSAIPSFVPGEFTAVQNEEQVEIFFEEKGNQENIEVLIFEEFNRDLEWVELQTVFPNATGNYDILDLFPHNGINRYRVTVILTNGETITTCIEAQVFFEPTNDFQVSPNPAQNDINVVLSDGSADGLLELEIYDGSGRIVMQQDFISTAGVARFDLDISQLALGQYYIRITGARGFERTTTFIKQSN